MAKILLVEDDYVLANTLLDWLEFKGHEAEHSANGEEALEKGAVMDVEQSYADKFRAEYESDDWLFAKSEKGRFANLLQQSDTIGRGRAKAVGGLIWATLVLREGRVLKAIINGDWHPRPLDSVSWLEDSLAGCAGDVESLRDCVAVFLSRDDIEFAGVTADDMASAMLIALGDQSPVEL